MTQTKLTHLKDRKEALISIFLNTSNYRLQVNLLNSIKDLDNLIKGAK
jgi:hypothetical protein